MRLINHPVNMVFISAALVALITPITFAGNQNLPYAVVFNGNTVAVVQSSAVPSSATSKKDASSVSSSKQWERYIPEKQRKDIYKKSMKATGMGAVFSGRAAACNWVTENLARALVSDVIDKERLMPDEAEARYHQLRPDGEYVFLIGSFGVGGFPHPDYRKTVIHPSESFLQRADDRQNFSKGVVNESEPPVYLHAWSTIGGTFVSARFSRLNRSNEPIIRDLNDKIEIQFVVSGKKFTLEYKIKEIVGTLEEL